MNMIAYIQTGSKGIKIGYKKSPWVREVGEKLKNDGQEVTVLAYGTRSECNAAANIAITAHNYHVAVHNTYPSVEDVLEAFLKA